MVWIGANGLPTVEAADPHIWLRNSSKGPYSRNQLNRQDFYALTHRILDKYRGSGGYHDIWDALGDSISVMDSNGFWCQAQEDRISRIGSFGGIYAERYAESVEEMIHEGQASVAVLDKQYELALNAYRRMGKRVGSNFIRSYQQMLALGQDVDTYFNQVAIATEEGGSYFGAKFAGSLPEVIEVGGDTEEFRTYAGLIRNKATYKAAVSYMNLAPKMLTKENGKLYGYAQVIIDGIRDLGPDTTYWLIPALVHLYPDLGTGQKQLVQRLADLRDEHGDKALGWMAYGLSNLGKALEWQSGWDKRVARADGRPQPAEERDRSKLVDPFIKSFIEVLTTAGTGAAIFYARSADPDGLEEYKDRLLALRNKIGRSTFSSATWVIQKVCTPKLSKSERKMVERGFGSHQARDMVAQLEVLSDHPIPQIREVINYTYGARRQGSVDGFIVPSEKMINVNLDKEEMLPEEALVQFQPIEEEVIFEGLSGEIPFFDELDGTCVLPQEEIPDEILEELNLGEEDFAELPRDNRLSKRYYEFEDEEDFGDSHAEEDLVGKDDGLDDEFYNLPF